MKEKKEKIHVWYQVCIKNIKDDRNKFICHLDMIREVTAPEIYKSALSKCLKNFQLNTIFCNKKKYREREWQEEKEIGLFFFFSLITNKIYIIMWSWNFNNLKQDFIISCLANKTSVAKVYIIKMQTVTWILIQIHMKYNKKKSKSTITITQSEIQSTNINTLKHGKNIKANM